MPTALSRWTLYRQAVVRIQGPDGLMAIQPTSGRSTVGAFPDVQDRTVHIVTAFNPTGRTANLADNARAQTELLAELRRRGLPWWPAEGGDVDCLHIEPSAAIVGLGDAAARDLGRRYGQDAIFVWDPASWRLLSCTDVHAETYGWTSTVSRA